MFLRNAGAGPRRIDRRHGQMRQRSGKHAKHGRGEDAGVQDAAGGRPIEASRGFGIDLAQRVGHGVITGIVAFMFIAAVQEANRGAARTAAVATG